PGSASRLARWRDRFHEPEIVGPLVTWPSGRRPDDPDLALINFGGLSCSALEPRTLVAYANAMAACALAALEDWPRRVLIACGRHVLDAMDQRRLRGIRADVELADLGHDAYLAELRRSGLLISSAGMHAIYEACAWGVPCVYLPAQNLSQTLALEAL